MGDKRFDRTDAEVLKSRPFPHPVRVLTGTTAYELRDGEVVLRNRDFELSTLDVDDAVGAK